MKIGTKVVVRLGRHRGKTAIVSSKKGHQTSKDEVVVNIVEGPIIAIHKDLVKLQPKKR